MFYDQFFSALVVILTAAVLGLKRNALSYPSGQFAIEALVLTGYALLKYVQLKAGFKGNKVESLPEMIVMFVLSCFCIFTNIYFLAWQTYIMYIELVLHLVAVSFCLGEMVMAVIALIMFKSLDA